LTRTRRSHLTTFNSRQIHPPGPSHTKQRREAQPQQSNMVVTRARNRAARIKAEEGPFRILDLPPELVEGIAENLDDQGLISVRKVCRALRRHSTKAFGTRFFSHLITILHPTSLAILLELSRHSVLSKFVRKVTISGERLGHSIQVMHTDMRPHYALQKSIENSGLDNVILTEAFRALKNLKVIQVDNCSYHNGDEDYCEDGIKCGRRLMYKETVPGFMLGGAADMGYSRVYHVVLKAIVDAGLQKDVDIALMFCVIQHFEAPVTFFDLHAAEWVKGASRKVRKLQIAGDLDPVWKQGLIQSTTDLRELDVQERHGIFRLSHTSGVHLVWPALHRLHLDEVHLHCDELIAFLRNHKDTLADLRLQSIGFPKGTWAEPLQAIKDIATLEHLFLKLLLEQLPYNGGSDMFDQYGDKDFSLELFFKEEISVALEALLGELRTTTVPYGYGIYDDMEFHEMVDLRKAQAVVDGDVVFRDGEWRICDEQSEIEEDDESEEDEGSGE